MTLPTFVLNLRLSAPPIKKELI